MSQHRSLTDLKNIGKKIADRLNEVGIFSEDDLQRIGAVEAHRLIREKLPDESLPVCYYLYSFEGALTDKHWEEIGEPRKHQLKTQIGYQNIAPDGNSATFHYHQ
ncbi:TfoX/Sxy family protein [Nitrosomonas ureae]|uniref:DNA transformation protein n=1 Tax=Nitrosomonas ureae TaxID=44577 RepID=A0A1H9AAR6_9PROT|nr:TfoX/Sxy family protein [Nitrosomonas ureae]SEP73543.1 DNA transformation protein [Nitrosomonas ureae]